MEMGAAGAMADDAQAWRDRLALRLLRSLVAIAAVGFLIVALTVKGPRDRFGMMALVGVATVLVAVAAVTRHPSGAARAWMVVFPSTVISL